MTSVQFTTWVRLEPVTSDPEIRPGLVAEVADPAWMLARQWQFGELQGDDAASPAFVEYSAAVGRPNRVQLGPSGTPTAYDPGAIPIDLLAEREPGPSAVPALLALEASLLLAEEFRAAGGTKGSLDDLRRAFVLAPLAPADLDELGAVARELFDASAAIAFDGVAAVRAPASAVPATARGAAFDIAAPIVRDWVAARLPASSAWVTDDLGSYLAVGVPAVGGGVTYEAARTNGERLSWSSFDRTNATIGTGSTVSTINETLPAVSLGINGAPALRYWEMEDGAVDLGAAGIAPSQLARLVVLEYILVYANDMVVVPVEVPYGSRCVVSSVVVVDTFGDRTTVAPAATASSGKFRMWEVSGDPGALFVPPVTISSVVGEPIEDVMIARDEQSNVAWLIELTGTDGAGGSFDLRSLAPPPTTAATVPPPAADAPLPAWKWRLATDAPPGWHPLLPEVSSSGLTRLVPGSVSGAPVPPARSRILSELRGNGIALDVVTAEGTRLRRRAEMARWIDGSRHVWVGRDRQVGRGDAGSGLLFDTLERGS